MDNLRKSSLQQCEALLSLRDGIIAVKPGGFREKRAKTACYPEFRADLKSSENF